ncbi:MAG: hypothetical protein HYW22_01590 [Candidatus Aenigmarchaeota archaeon]|nr:hypothetical protein [Candidatus Aenigmarchaeota archaeon]
MRIPSIRVSVYEISIWHVLLGVVALFILLAIFSPSTIDKINQTIQEIVIALAVIALLIAMIWAAANQQPRRERRVIVIDG